MSWSVNNYVNIGVKFTYIIFFKNNLKEENPYDVIHSSLVLMVKSEGSEINPMLINLYPF